MADMLGPVVISPVRALETAMPATGGVTVLETVTWGVLVPEIDEVGRDGIVGYTVPLISPFTMATLTHPKSLTSTWRVLGLTPLLALMSSARRIMVTWVRLSKHM
jgi:hypothetical protein